MAVKASRREREAGRDSFDRIYFMTAWQNGGLALGGYPEGSSCRKEMDMRTVLDASTRDHRVVVAPFLAALKDGASWEVFEGTVISSCASTVIPEKSPAHLRGETQVDPLCRSTAWSRARRRRSKSPQMPPGFPT